MLGAAEPFEWRARFRKDAGSALKAPTTDDLLAPPPWGNGKKRERAGAAPRFT